MPMRHIMTSSAVLACTVTCRPRPLDLWFDTECGAAKRLTRPTTWACSHWRHEETRQCCRCQCQSSLADSAAVVTQFAESEVGHILVRHCCSWPIITLYTVAVSRPAVRTRPSTSEWRHQCRRVWQIFYWQSGGNAHRYCWSFSSTCCVFIYRKGLFG